MKKITFIILVLIFCFSALLSNAQNPTATLGNVVGKNKGDTVLIPLYVTGFKNIGTIELYINIDTNVLINFPGNDTSCVTHISAALNLDSNTFMSNFNKTTPNANELMIVFMVSPFNTTGIDIPDGKLMDLIFLYKGGITPVCFDTANCPVGDINGNDLNVTYYCGNIENINYCQANYQIKNDSSEYTFDFFDKSEGYNVTKWSWDFGDSETSTDKNPVHKFQKIGMYKVCLTITSTDSGKVLCTDTFCNYVDVEQNISNDCNAFFNVFYNDSTANYSFIDQSIGNNISGWSWDFGDNTPVSDLQNPIHKYQKSGDYTVCLTISSFKDGKLSCSDTYCENIFVQTDTAINQCVAAPYILQDSIPWKYDFFGYAAGDSITWSWDFGDGYYSSNRNTTHTYTSPGEYIACLTINSYTGGIPGCTNTDCQTIKIDSIAKLPPNYCFNYFTYYITDTSKAKFNVSFTAYTESNNQLYYNWDFGDGAKTTVTNSFVSHTFADKSVFNACLKTYPVSDSSSCSFTSCKEIFGYIDTAYSFGSISGQVFAGTNYADSGFVALIKLDSIFSGHISYFNVVKISASGYYSFSHIPFGNYYVFAMLIPSSEYYMKYIPAFYGNTWNWEDAKTVLAGNNQASNNININLVSLYSKKSIGDGCISGNIYNPDFKPGAKTSYSYVEVVLLDNNNKPIAFTYTDPNGNYKFSNLDYGTYNVAVMIIGLNVPPAQLIIDSKTPCVNNVDFLVDYFSTLPIANYLNGIGIFYSIPQLSIAGTQISNIFPNPVNQSSVINYQLPARSLVNIKVCDFTGREVSTLMNGMQDKGAYKINLNANHYKDGMYFIKFETNNGVSILKFIKD